MTFANRLGVWAAVAALTAAVSAQAQFNPFKKKDKGAARKELHKGAEAALKRFREQDPDIESFFKKASGYAIFPTVAKGGVGIGGAYGRGEVRVKDKVIGYASLKQATIGFQLGGQTYSELIFFENEKALNDFKNGNFEFGAQVSAVAATAGASADANFDQGLLVFSLAKVGLMYEASVGGQKFSFEAAKE